MELKELKAAANKFCNEHWGINYTGELDLINRHWKYKNAHFETKTNDPKYHKIVMSKKRNALRTKKQVLNSLLHELVHWRLWSLGLPFDDTDIEFVQEAVRVGASISGTQEARKALEIYEAVQRRKQGVQMTIYDFVDEE